MLFFKVKKFGFYVHLEFVYIEFETEVWQYFSEQWRINCNF